MGWEVTAVASEALSCSLPALFLSPPLLVQKAFTISAADAGAAKGTSPGPEAGALLPRAAPQPCWDVVGGEL